MDMVSVYSYTRYQGGTRTEESDLADRLMARLKAEGIPFTDEPSGNWHDCECTVPDPEGGWHVELDASCPYRLSVPAAHAERARQLLAELSRT